MSVRAILVLFLALVCGASAAVGINQMRRPSQVFRNAETTPIVVASVDICRGRMVTGDDVELRDWPTELLPTGVLTSVEDALDRSAMTGIVVGEPIMESKLATKESGRGLAALIPEGMRAYTIQTSRVASNVAGFILPGNSVDVLLTLRGNHNDTTGGGSTTTLLQAVEILAVDQRLDAPVDNKINPRELGSVTLLVTPEQAALLDLGQNMGTLTLSLRNPEDAGEALTRPATLNDIRFRQEKPVEHAERHAPLPDSSNCDEVLEIVTLRGSHRGRIIVNRQN
jgi:pilus assembly protein CpaB